MSIRRLHRRRRDRSRHRRAWSRCPGPPRRRPPADPRTSRSRVRLRHQGEGRRRRAPVGTHGAQLDRLHPPGRQGQDQRGAGRRRPDQQPADPARRDHQQQLDVQGEEAGIAAGTESTSTVADVVPRASRTRRCPRRSLTINGLTTTATAWADHRRQAARHHRFLGARHRPGRAAHRYAARRTAGPAARPRQRHGRSDARPGHRPAPAEQRRHRDPGARQARARLRAHRRRRAAGRRAGAVAARHAVRRRRRRRRRRRLDAQDRPQLRQDHRRHAVRRDVRRRLGRGRRPGRRHRPHRRHRAEAAALPGHRRPDPHQGARVGHHPRRELGGLQGSANGQITKIGRVAPGPRARSPTSRSAPATRR